MHFRLYPYLTILDKITFSKTEYSRLYKYHV